MYEQFYGLKQRPFTKTPDPRFLYLSKNHEEALARLQYAVEEKELIMLTGEVGSGKTTLTRVLMDSLGEPCDDLTELTRLMKFGKSNPMKTGEFSRVTGVPMLLHLQQDRISVAVK